VECVYSAAPPPMELQLAWMCGDHRLPDGGGVLDQDAGLMRRLTCCRNIYQVLYRMKHLTGKQIHTMTDNERKLVKALRDGGYLG
jgi:hypothetical protein